MANQKKVNLNVAKPKMSVARASEDKAHNVKEMVDSTKRIANATKQYGATITKPTNSKISNGKSTTVSIKPTGIVNKSAINTKTPAAKKANKTVYKMRSK